MAIAIRSQRLGFVVLEGALGLLDWRTVHYEHNSSARVKAAMKKLVSLFALFTPSMIAIERSRLSNARNASGADSIYRSTKREAALRFIPVLIMNRSDVRSTFRGFNAKTKGAIAGVLAQMFPELLSKLPPERKIWRREHWIMPVFDAVALAVACWDRYNARDPTLQ